MASVSKALLQRMYDTKRMSIPDVAMALGIPRSAARKALLDAGIVLRTRADGVRAVSHKLGKQSLGKKRVFSDEHKANIATARRAHADQNAAGVSIKPNGYVEITRGPNKFRGQHVVVMEQHIGRSLARNEVVHHIDGDRKNNTLSNLQLMTRADHTRLHRREQSQGASNGKR